MFGSKKGKSYDPTKLEIQFRVMKAEVTTASKKQQQIIDVNCRGLGRDVNAKNKTNIYDKARKIADAKVYIEACNLLLESMKIILENKADCVASRDGPSPATEEYFRNLCCAADLIKLDSFKKFKLAIHKEIFDKKVGPDLCDTARCDDRITHGFTGGNHDDGFIKKCIREAAENFATVEDAEKAIGCKLDDEPEPEPQPVKAAYQQPKQPVGAPAAAPAANVAVVPQGRGAISANVSAEITEHDDLFICADLEPVDRSVWGSLLEDIKNAVA